FLYAASNLGSLVALLSYPTLIEPALSLAEQSRWWTAGYLLLAGLTAICAAITMLRRIAIREEPSSLGEVGPRAREGRDWLMRGRWTLSAFVPSSLLLGVTTHLTTDVAAAPLFWVVPLILYLASFVLAFQTLWVIPQRVTAYAQALLLVPLAVTLMMDPS